MKGVAQAPVIARLLGAWSKWWPLLRQLFSANVVVHRVFRCPFRIDMVEVPSSNLGSPTK